MPTYTGTPDNDFFYVTDGLTGDFCDGDDGLDTLEYSGTALPCPPHPGLQLDTSGNWWRKRFRDSLSALICRRDIDARTARVLGL